MRDLVDTTEMYLRTVYELEEEGITPLRARIAERLEQSGPTVSQTVSRMERDGLLVVQPDRSLALTPAGRQRATAVMRKHRLAELLLTDVLQLNIAQVHDEACRWEHVMSEDVERRVVAVLGNPTRSPFGNPIPALEELDATPSSETAYGTRASDLELDGPTEVTVVQVSEILQQLSATVSPTVGVASFVGSQVTLEQHDGGAVMLTTKDGDRVELSPELAHALRVDPVED
ncbi:MULTISPECIES: metal-dependent transcriptional regulator [Corynebacterium]|uniref:Diphtheria toxin repressor n=1 Tax=Corynebacterium hadale TaxID=2026255 RepID=A0A269PAY4_9CORY|nr:metal-dependent transcriptional regulator [Corynebacterium hadale]PAJ68196.1 metal-dependent regulator [Corynebacterium hadale]WKC60287.1 Diphtheria toxin repressor [Corynebacterium hadale]